MSSEALNTAPHRFKMNETNKEQKDPRLNNFMMQQSLQKSQIFQDSLLVRENDKNIGWEQK